MFEVIEATRPTWLLLVEVFLCGSPRNVLFSRKANVDELSFIFVCCFLFSFFAFSFSDVFFFFLIFTMFFRHFFSSSNVIFLSKTRFFFLHCFSATNEVREQIEQHEMILQLQLVLIVLEIPFFFVMCDQTFTPHFLSPTPKASHRAGRLRRTFRDKLYNYYRFFSVEAP